MTTPHALRFALFVAISTGSASCGQLGGNGGFRVRDGLYAITVQGGGFTTKAALMERWHKRARELCHGDYTPQTEASDFASYSGGYGSPIMSFQNSTIQGYAACDSPKPVDRDDASAASTFGTSPVDAAEAMPAAAARTARYQRSPYDHPF